LETTSLSVARGTANAFLAYGAPWVDAGGVIKNLTARQIPGVTFEACTFVPKSPGFSYKGLTCFGVCLTVHDRERFDPTLTGLHLAQAFYEVHPKRFKAYEGFATEVGDREAWRLITAGGMKPEELVGQWGNGLNRFREIRKKYLLYPD
jgi:beta-N-acetylhexosaminidase